MNPYPNNPYRKTHDRHLVSRVWFLSILPVIVTITAFTLQSHATTYYVSLTGSNTNSGLSQASAWRTLTYAVQNASPVVAGDTIYMEAGDYGAENVEFEISGTVGAPIVIAGYQLVPGDAPPLLVDQSDLFAAFDPALMPTFDGGDRTSGVGIDLRNEHDLELRNLQIHDYAYGLYAGSSSQSDQSHHTLYNVNVHTVGNFNAYSGLGITLGSMGTRFSNSNTLINCLVVNAAAEGITLNGDHNQVTGCKVLCNDIVASGAATDYYLMVCGSYNIIDRCYIERLPDLSHNGHGMGVKSNAEQVVDDGLSLPVITPQYNLFRNCTAVNLGEAFYVRHRPVQYNTFQHCTAIGTHTGADGSGRGEGNAFVVRDGASNNTFDGGVAQNCLSGFNFLDTVEDGDTGPNPTGHPGNNNVLTNCVVNNCYIGVRFNDYSIPSDAGENTIANCTFYNVRYMFGAYRACTNMNYINNIFHGTLPATPGGSFKTGAFSGDIQPNNGTTFSHCDFVNIQGGMPGGFVAGSINGLAVDPLFVDAATGDLHLQAASPCVDAGITFAAVDHDSIARPQGVGTDIGAYEYSAPLAVAGAIPNTTDPVITVVPNPTSGAFNLNIQGVPPSEAMRVTVLDASGRTHYTASVISSGPRSVLRIDPEGTLSPGLYLVTASYSGKILEQRIIVQ